MLAAIFAIPAFAQQPSIAYDELHRGLTDANPAKRIAAVLSLGVAKPAKDPVALVEGMLADKDSGTRAAACATLGEMKSRTSIPKLRDALDDKTPEVIFASAKALFAMGDPQGRLVLAEVLEGDQKDKSGIVSSSIRDAKLKLHDPKALVLLGVTSGAGFAGFGAGVPIAEMLLKDNQASGKTAAALLLATDHSPETAEAVKTALSDKNWTVRVAAIRAAALLELTGLYDDMSILLDADKRDEVRYAAAGALIRFKQAPPARRQNKGR
ncbi:MAG: HEAT repeat domain-containing protein [Acidobacteriota bacterium]|nr:HEAT repeat domain-containing protein [Acidobacteriota bacterium]